MVKVLLPILTEDLDILYFVDKNNQKYKDFSEILVEDNIDVFFHYYNVVYEKFEKWGSENGITIKYKSDGIYTGTPRTYNWRTADVSQRTTYSDPKCNKCRGLYNGCRFHFYNINNYLRGTSDFNIHQEELAEHENYIEYFIKVIVPQCKFKTSMPNSIASAARNIFIDLKVLNCNPENYEYQVLTRSSAVGGLYYLKDTTHRYKIIYDYDISSMYPYMLTNRNYPLLSVLPKEYDFLKKTKGNQLALYHLTNLTAFLKPKHFPTMFTHKEDRKRLLQWGFIDNSCISLNDLPDIEGWITSIDYEMLLRDYDIVDITINKTLLYNVVIPGNQYFGKLKDYYEKKQQATGHLRTLYKVLIDSFSGSLAMKIVPSIKKISVSTDKRDWLIPENYSSPSNVYAFMTAYSRQFISDLALRAGYDNVVSIDTDGIFSTNRELDKYCGEGLGSLRLDKIMLNAKWFGQKQYEYKDENGEWTPTIAGLPAYVYKHNQMDYCFPVIQYDKNKKKYVKKSNNFKLGGKDEIR